MTLNYLLKIFVNGFIDLGENNYCEDFVITEASI